jgi:hypothetical protein
MKLENKYLDPKYKGKSEDYKFYLIAHNIRNEFHNLRRDL